jgi:hypothetical protein
MARPTLTFGRAHAQKGGANGPSNSPHMDAAACPCRCARRQHRPCPGGRCIVAGRAVVHEVVQPGSLHSRKLVEHKPHPEWFDAHLRGPRFDPHLSSGFVLETSTGTATGHCSLSWTTGTGRCIIDSGTGSLTGLHAVLSEWVDFGTGEFDTFVFHLDRSYHID